nr:zinc finger protein 236-like isoform X1 [Aedes albopictus]XP_029724674.1 zinc finger protein 236-like isoform X1 [Aedes albopictus]XP_029724675.1 zinc finger protein 236-like isoform X1 [Aedes albopictus]XP_029724676.1 zinc finger protein 236-like isoform X1 [Aedes albopictus]XP_029724677.1 zinc finger protein 236-like isoform X1 [Aedes albopictus]XP_029724678.1 zinc finger protein 236-like isoform X1 [Aedes albopictus]XP_029724679.1 zinc finger protein 236-like isoform X1 [Aedes albopictu
MEATTGGGSKAGRSVETIKVEPDFYFPAAEMVIDDDFDDDDEEGGQLEMHQIDLYDSPASTKLVQEAKKYEVMSDVEDDEDNFDEDEDEDDSNSNNDGGTGQGKKYECKLCEKSFFSPGHLARHARIHTGERPFQCSHCDKAFIESSSLKVHLRTHTGEKPFRCELCNKDFTQSCNLHSHYRRGHGVDPKVTPRLFDQMRQQAAASAATSGTTSTSPAPSQWPSQSVSVRAMPKLIPKPTGQPFQCCVCEEPFFDRDLLLIHEETHVPEAPFECRFCTTMFSGLANLRSHVNVHKVNMRAQPPQALHPIRQSTAGIRVFANGPVARKLDPVPDAGVSNAVLNSNQPFIPSGDEQRPYKCVECKANFEKHELYFHMRAHLKQKNIFSKKSLKCEKCGKVFEKELTLKKHMDMVHPVVSSVSSGDGSFLLEALKTDARSLSPAATKSGKVQISSEVEVQEPDDIIEIKQEPESALGDDQVNSTVSDNPILTHLLNTNSNELQQQPSQQHSRNGSPPVIAPAAADNDPSNEGGFVISAVATVDHNFLERLERMEQRQKQQQEQQELDSQPVSSGLRRMPVLEESLRRPPVMISSNKSTAPPSQPIIPSGPYRCSFCQKEFSEHFGLRQHIRAMHYSEKRHKCKECNKKFSLGISLAIHRRVHTSIRPFTCIVCYKTFTRSTALNGHLSSHSYTRVKCAECDEEQLSVFNYMKHIEKFHPHFMQNVTSYRNQAEALMQRRRQLILEITEGLAKHRSEIPNVLARLRGELGPVDSRSKNDDEDEVSSSEHIAVNRRRPDSSQSEEVSSASEEQEARRKLESLPALRAELRKRPLRSNTAPDELDESVLPPFRKSARSAGSSSPNLKRLLEQNSSRSNSSEATEQGIPPAVSVKDEPSSN